MAKPFLNVTSFLWKEGSKMAQPTYYALFLWKRVAAGRVIAGTKSRTREAVEVG